MLQKLEPGRSPGKDELGPCEQKEVPVSVGLVLTRFELSSIRNVGEVRKSRVQTIPVRRRGNDEPARPNHPGGLRKKSLRVGDMFDHLPENNARKRLWSKW